MDPSAKERARQQRLSLRLPRLSSITPSQFFCLHLPLAVAIARLLHPLDRLISI
jgi:hypothetical protein